MLNGPPIPAPPSFLGLALVGLAALALMRRPGCLTVTPATTFSPNATRRPGTSRRGGSSTSAWRSILTRTLSFPTTNGRQCCAICRPHRAAAARPVASCAARRDGRRQARGGPEATATATTASPPIRARRGAAASAPSTPRRIARRGATLPRARACTSRMRSSRPRMKGDAFRRLGRHATPRSFSRRGCCTTLSAPITPIPRRGTKSASAGRRARAAMCG